MIILFFHNLLIHSLTIERIIILIHHWHFGIIVTTGSSGIVVGRFTNAGLATVLGKAETTGWTAEKGPSTFMSWRQVGWRGIHSRTHDFPWYVGQASSAKKKKKIIIITTNNTNNHYTSDGSRSEFTWISRAWPWFHVSPYEWTVNLNLIFVVLS